MTEPKRIEGQQIDVFVEMRTEIARLKLKCARQRTELRRVNKAILSWRRVAELATARRMIRDRAAPEAGDEEGA